MTLDEFLDDYVPRVLRPMGDWALVEHDAIRRREDGYRRCPLLAAANGWSARDAAARIGLDHQAAGLIMSAADCGPDCGGPHEPEQPLVRARLLAGLGLSEPGAGSRGEEG